MPLFQMWMSVPSRNLAKTEQSALTHEAVTRVLVWEIGSRENIATKVRISPKSVHHDSFLPGMNLFLLLISSLYVMIFHFLCSLHQKWLQRVCSGKSLCRYFDGNEALHIFSKKPLYQLWD